MSIQIDKVSKSFGDLRVLDNLTLEMDFNKSYCIMGPSGCGKSTLLNILMGLMPPDKGKVTGIDGLFIAPVFQEDRLCENLSVMANIRLASKLKLNSDEISAVLSSLLIFDCLKKPVKELSGGMKRRVALARAFLSSGEVFIFDEPFKGLDEDTKKAVMAYAKSFLKDKTFIWVTHDPMEAEVIGGNLIKLDYLL